MPEISRFFGIVIRMFFNDHEPPHFHAVYGGHEALIEIETLSQSIVVIFRAGPLPWFSSGPRFTVNRFAMTGGSLARVRSPNRWNHWSE